MKSLLIRIIPCFSFLLVTTASLFAGKTGPPFTQCSPSGYNCNILITLDRYGNLSVSTDPKLTYYPPTHSSNGSLIGFQNNSGASVYSLSLTAKSGLGYPAYSFCGSMSTGMGANVSVVNIPSFWNKAAPPWYYYNACFGGLPMQSCPHDPYGMLYLKTSCDIVFTGGIPNGGTTYFSLDNAAPNYPYFDVTKKTVIPYITFQDSLNKGQTAVATVTLSPPGTAPVTLTLTPVTGTGLAVFTATNSTTMTINQSGSVEIKGVEASSKAANIELSASVNDVRRVVNFTILDAPVISFQPGVVKGQTATANVSLSLSPSPVSVSLNLATTAGTGSAVFTSTNSTTMTITESGSVQIKGVETSSTADNIELSASLNGLRTAVNFSVIWVDLVFRNTGRYSDDDDNSAAAGFAASHGDLLGNQNPGINNVLIIGAVSPSNFTESIQIKRKVTSAAIYSDTTDGSTLLPNQFSGTGEYTCSNSDKTQCADDSGDTLEGNQDSSPSSSGHIYDLDAPGPQSVPQVANEVARFRANWAEFASYQGVRASDLLTWYARSSACIRTDPGDVLTVTWCTASGVDKGVTGDDQSGSGSTTSTSWNLQ